jgi:hypothetical protein
MSRMFVRLVSLLAALGGMACASQGTVGDPEGTALDQEQAALDFDPDSLRSGHATLMVGSISGAENLLFTTDDRLFVSADAGLFEIVASPDGGFVSHMLHDGASCQFGGIAEARGYLYANCYDGTDSRLFAAELTDDLQFVPIFELPGVALANGLASDGAGRLYIGATILGQILRLQLSATDPSVVVAKDAWIPDAGLFANGVDFAGGALYWTDFGTIKSAIVGADGTPGPIRTRASGLAFYDDLYVDGSEIVAASFLAGSIQVFDQFGLPRGNTAGGVFNGPTAVLPARGRLGLPDDALVVSERSGNQVSFFAP